MNAKDLILYRRIESFEHYYKRCSLATDYILTKQSPNDTVLIVAHAANLDSNTRALLNGSAITLEHLKELVKTVAYCGLLAIEHDPVQNKWLHSEPFILPLTHSRNFQFDPRTFSELYRN